MSHKRRQRLSVSFLAAIAITSVGLAGCMLDTSGQAQFSDNELDASIDGSGGYAGGSGGSGGSAGTGGSSTVSCFPPKKKCPVNGKDECVDNDDWHYGCTEDDCDSCPNPEHTSMTCINQECVPGNCAAGWGDCDGQATPGCETHLDTDPYNCGSCGKNCYEGVVNVGTVQCEAGKCNYDHCNPGFDDCDNDTTTGCETNIWNLNKCGSCGAGACTVNNGEPSCSNGLCHANSCDKGWDTCKTDCDTHIAVDMNNCGGCGNSCKHNDGTDHAVTSCAGGQCLLTSCVAPWKNCDNNLANWCESNTNTSVNHCGGCAPCSSKNVKTRACNKGKCDPICKAGFGNCNGAQSGNVDDGCETPLNTVDHCGSCTNECTATNGVPECAYENGTYFCRIKSCNPPFEDCDGKVSNGCEINTSNNVGNCGGCTVNGKNFDCHALLPNAKNVQCSGSNCVFSGCSTGTGDCDGNTSNGCETNTTNTTKHCGDCSTDCNNVLPHDTGVSCSGSTCTSTGCASPYADCDGNTGNGCETNTTNTTKHCGDCSTDCNTVLPHDTGVSCSGSTCTSTGCAGGYGDCDGNTGNGCETNTTNTTEHCGNCSTDCNKQVENAAGIKCTSSKCGYDSCSASYKDCDGDVSNGCECKGLCKNGICTAVSLDAGIADAATE